jgi:hypothetical protein
VTNQRKSTTKRFQLPALKMKLRSAGFWMTRRRVTVRVDCHCSRKHGVWLANGAVVGIKHVLAGLTAKHRERWRVIWMSFEMVEIT